jgi:hypothetical protein
VLRRPKSTPERAARVFTPPADLLLTEEDLREWRAAIAPALEEAGCEIGAEVVREVRPADWTVSTFEEGPDGGRLAPAWTVARPPQVELRLRVAAPHWVRARSLELRLTGDGGCSIAQASGGYKSARATCARRPSTRPRWLPSGRGASSWATCPSGGRATSARLRASAT